MSIALLKQTNKKQEANDKRWTIKVPLVFKLLVESYSADFTSGRKSAVCLLLRSIPEFDI